MTSPAGRASAGKGGSLTGTRTLLRLALRLDRLRLTVWVLVIGLTPAVTAAQYKQLYPTQADLDQVSGVVGSASLVALNGPMYGVSLGGLTAWKIGVTELILVALMSLLTVIRHSRTEEETGRLELLGAGVLGRYAPLTAAVAVAALADLAAGALVVLGLAGSGMPAAGSLALGLSVAGTGLLFAGVAAVAAQVTESARTATAIAAAVLGVAYLLRALGDSGPSWVGWLSPMGWALRSRPYAGDRWWLLALLLVLAALFTALGYALSGRRDLGAGLVPPRPGPARAGAALGSPFGLAWRQHRGLLLGWVIGMAVWGLVLGGAAKGIGDAVLDNSKISDMLARLGGAKGLVDAYLAAVFGITGLVAAIYTVQTTLRLRTEETAGRVEPILATRVGRVQWMLSHLVFALAGTAVLLAVSGLGAGIAYGGQLHDSGQVGRLLVAALVQTPAAWVLAGIGAALFGLLPRLAAGLTWAALVACLLILELGEILGLSQWLVDVSPFAHAPRLPGSGFTATPLVSLTVIAVALGALGLAGFRRRDVG